MVYTPIDSAQEYNPDTFKDAFGKLSQIEGSLERLVRDPTNPGVLQALGSEFHDFSEFYETLTNPSVIARKDGSGFLSAGREAIIEYSKIHSEKLFSFLGDEGYRLIIQELPLEKSEAGDEDYNSYVDALNEKRKIIEISQDPNQIRGFVNNKINSLPEWLQRIYSSSMSNEGYRRRLFEGYAQKPLVKLEKMLTKENGSEDTEKIKRFAETSLRVAKQKDNKEYFMALAETAYRKMVA